MSRLGNLAEAHAALRTRWRPADWPNASLYCLFARRFFLESALVGTLRTATSAAFRQRRFFGSSLGLKTVALLEKILDEDLSDIDVRLGVGLQIDRRRTLQSDELRYCPACLRLGYHSSMFQHYSLARCPEHEVLLRRGCPSCRSPLNPNLAQASVDPFACAKCGHLFISSVAAPTEGPQLISLDKRLGQLRHSVVSVSGRECCDPPTSLPMRDAYTSRIARHFAVWVLGEIWGTFDEERILEDEPRDPWSDDIHSTDRAAGAALRFIYHACGTYHSDMELISARVRAASSGTRLSGTAMAASVAFYKTALAFRASDIETPSCIGTSSQWNPAFAMLCFSGKENVSLKVLERLRQLEIYAFFCFALIEASRTKRLSDYSFAVNILTSMFSPAWCRQQEKGVVVVRIRPRAVERTVLRLVERFGWHRLVRDEAGEIPCHSSGEVRKDNNYK